MIVSIPDNINHQESERKSFLKKTYGEVLNLKLKAIIARERLLYFFVENFNGPSHAISHDDMPYTCS
jgi:hypothetical protein